MQKLIVVFCALIGVTFAAVALGKAEPKPEKYKDVEGCYIGSLDEVIPPGESRPAKDACLEYRCDTDWVQTVSCGAVHVAAGHKVVEDKEKPYPNCCPRVS